MVGSLRGHPGPPVSEQRKHTWSRSCAVWSPKFTVARAERTSGGPLLGEGRQLFQNMFLNFPSLAQILYQRRSRQPEKWGTHTDTPKQLLLRFLFLRDVYYSTCHCHPSRSTTTYKRCSPFSIPSASFPQHATTHAWILIQHWPCTSGWPWLLLVVVQMLKYYGERCMETGAETASYAVQSRRLVLQRAGASCWLLTGAFYLGIPKFIPKFHYAKRRFHITSKCRYIYGVLNVDEIKN
jgi:hypothetical protein